MVQPVLSLVVVGRGNHEVGSLDQVGELGEGDVVECAHPPGDVGAGVDRRHRTADRLDLRHPDVVDTERRTAEVLRLDGVRVDEVELADTRTRQCLAEVGAHRPAADDQHATIPQLGCEETGGARMEDLRGEVRPPGRGGSERRRGSAARDHLCDNRWEACPPVRSGV